MIFNKNQLSAIRHINGPMAVIAGPGSGKTSVLIHRISNLINNNIAPESILAITFTKAAASEMQERFEQLQGNHFNSPSFGTFHSIFLTLLKEYYSHKMPTIIDTKLKSDIIRSEILRFYDNEHEINHITDEILSELNNSRGDKLIDTDSEFNKTIIKNYHRIKKEMNYIDYDDILYISYSILSTKADYLKKWQQRYKYIIIDEFQDINMIQYKLIRLLAEESQNIFIVGDDDQCIYNFRGSSVDIFSTFFRDFYDSELIMLNTNYRSTSKIVRYSSALITFNKNRIDKNIVSASNSRNGNCLINCYHDQEEEYRDISRRILQYNKAGIPLSEIAILGRSNRNLSVLSTWFEKNEIPVDFTIKNNTPQTYGLNIASDITAYLKISTGKYSYTDLLRILNKPQRNISVNGILPQDNADHFSILADYYYGNASMLHKIRRLKDDINFLAKINPCLALDYINHALGYKKYISHVIAEKPFEKDKIQTETEQIAKYAEGCRNIEEFLDVLNSQNARTVNNDQSRRITDGIRIMSIHASKGLEFNTVFIPDINKGIIPSGNITSIEELEEERRILYVGMTRAKENLHLSYVELIKQKHIRESLFIDELLNQTDH